MITAEVILNLINQAKEVLTNNLREVRLDSGTELFAVPNQRLYPAAWGWDTPKIAAGVYLFNPEDGLRLFESFLNYQWPNAMIPHIVFPTIKAGEKLDPNSYFPPPHVWYYEGDSAVDYADLDLSSILTHPDYIRNKGQTTAISQYPVWSILLKYMYEHKSISKDRLGVLVKKLDQSHRFFYQERDPLNWGIVAEYHPWIGCDNAPPYKKALERISINSTKEELQLINQQRIDLKVTLREGRSIDTRPTDQEYHSFLMIAHSLARALRKREENRSKISINELLFCCYSPMLNGILIRAELDLSQLANYVGDKFLANECLIRARNLSNNLFQKLYSTENRGFFYFDAVSNEPWQGEFIGLYFPLLDPYLDTNTRSLLIEQLNKNFISDINYPLPTTSPHSKYFNRMKYWQGPTWLTTNFFIYLALKDNFKEAETILKSSLELLIKSGFREYFDCYSGSGYGADNFGWSAAFAAILGKELINMPHF